MTYALGVDLGTTFTAAAIADPDGARMVGLTHDGVAIPSVLTRTTDGIAVGGEALAVAATRPWMVAREFKRRFGDETPFIVGDDRWTASELTGLLFDWVVERVASIEGAPPAKVTITHPATWSVHRLELLERATSRIDAERTFIPEPSAAAIRYHERSRIAEGASIAVYDLGGGTFDATVLRRTGDGYDVVGRPSGIEQLGGLDLDQVVFDLVVDTMPEVFEALDPDDLDTQRSVARLREECTRAKISLSFDARTAVPVVLPGVATDVLVSRSDFEDRIEPYVSQSIATLVETIGTGDLEPSDLSSILLVGGSSRVPMVAERLHSALGVDVVVDTHPKFAVAMGAVLSSVAAPPAPHVDAANPVETDPAMLASVEQNPLPEATVDISAMLEAAGTPRVVVVSGPSAGRSVDLPEGPTTIGRSADKADVAIADPVASRLHLRLDRSGAELRAADLGSTAGTRVNRTAISGEVPVEVGSLIEMGSTWLLIDDPLRRVATPGAVLLELAGSAQPFSPGKPAHGWITLGFGGEPMSPVRIQLSERVTDLAVPGSLGEDLLRSMLVEMLVLERTLPVALLTTQRDRWAPLMGEPFSMVVCADGNDVPSDVIDHGVLVVEPDGIDASALSVLRERKGRGGIVWHGRGPTERDRAEQVIELDATTAAIQVMSPGAAISVDVPATLGPAAVTEFRLSR